MTMKMFMIGYTMVMPKLCYENDDVYDMMYNDCTSGMI